MLLLSILYQMVRLLLGLTAVLVRRDLSKDAELLVLRHENTGVRRQISRVRYRPVDRAWLAALSRLVPRHRWAEVFPVAPATILAWHRNVGLAERGLLGTSPTRASPDRSSDQKTGDSLGSRESHLGTSARARRTGPARPSHRRLHRVADPA